MIEIIIAAIIGMVQCIICVPYMHFFQLNTYRINTKYFKVFKWSWTWILTLGGIIFCLIFFLEQDTALMDSIFLFGCAIAVPFIYKRKTKVKYKRTYRVLRQTVMNFILFSVSAYFLPFLMIFIVPFMPIISGLIMLPFEKLNNNRYIKKAIKKINGYNGLKKIIVTGSYGKTSVKNYLNELIKDDYNVVISPASYNTPMGIAMTINDKLNSQTEILIAEAGARHMGDIKEICDIVSPDMVILTGIAAQHIETFKSIENVIATKFEAMEALKDDGIFIINSDNELLLKEADKRNRKYYSAGLNGKDVSIDKENITIDGEKFSYNTKLLGKHNLSNIAVAALAAYLLNIEPQIVAEKINEITPVPHRLEVIYSNGLTIIDDSYNCNELSAKSAIEAVGEMQGRKGIITCGIVEGGHLQKKLNFELGRQIAEVFDYVCVIGINADAIREGLYDTKFDSYRVYEIQSVKEGVKILNKYLGNGDALLFLNDLSDNYI